jgi:hypothetical protein
MPRVVPSGIVSSATALALALPLAGCSFPMPQPEPTPRPVADCLDPSDPGVELSQDAQDGLDLLGLWSHTWADPPSAEYLRHPAPVPPGFDPRRKVYLTTILIAPGVSGRVSIVKPQDARLFVAPDWERMGSLTALELQVGATRSVHLTGCAGVASYPGLTIVDGPECVVFAVQRDDDDNRVTQVSVPFFGADC